MTRDPRSTVVVLTHERAAEVERTLARLVELPERPRIVVVDNGSHDGTAGRIARRFPAVEVLRLAHNAGAAGRNAGAARVGTPYVAFCDDDSWWAPGALARAADLLDAHPRVAAVAARVLVGADERLDPTCAAMAASPLDSRGLPGPALIGFMAGAVVLRTRAFRDAGGYEPRLVIGAEEELLGLDLAARGWRIVYADAVVAHHHPSPARDARARALLHARNRLWIAGLRLRPAAAWRESVDALRAAHGVRAPALLAALGGLRWVLAERRPVPRQVEAMYRRVHRAPASRGVSATRA
ncbi:MAG TPA: glycosyltransferase [Burkholderiaceae bacterium]